MKKIPTQGRGERQGTEFFQFLPFFKKNRENLKKN